MRVGVVAKSWIPWIEIDWRSFGHSYSPLGAVLIRPLVSQFQGGGCPSLKSLDSVDASMRDLTVNEWSETG
jgi:hypothetical protein